MIFEFTETRCILEILGILSARNSKYSEMFKKIKVSHTTLQSVLRKLVQKQFVIKHNLGHQNVSYELTSKGKELLEILLQLYRLVKD